MNHTSFMKRLASKLKKKADCVLHRPFGRRDLWKRLLGK